MKISIALVFLFLAQISYGQFNEHSTPSRNSIINRGLENLKKADSGSIGASLSFGIGVSYLPAFHDILGPGFTAQVNVMKTINDFSAFRVDLTYARFAGKTSYWHEYEHVIHYRARFDFLLGTFRNRTVPYAFGGFGIGFWNQGSTTISQTANKIESYFMTEVGVGGGLIFSAGTKLRMYGETQYSFFSFIKEGIKYGAGYNLIKATAGVILRLQ